MARRDEAIYLGEVPLDWLKVPPKIENWQTYETEDIFATNLITIPNDYLLTLGSGVFTPCPNLYASMATTPAYPLPTSTQMYVAGRDVIRWGGKSDPYEVDFDRYIFTPLSNGESAAVFKAPKSEPHHLSSVPDLISKVPKDWQEMFVAIKNGEFK